MTESYTLFPQIHTSEIDSLLSINSGHYQQHLQPQQYSHQEHLDLYQHPQQQLQHQHQQQQQQQQQEQNFLFDPMLGCYFQSQRSTSTGFEILDSTIYPITPMQQHGLYYDSIPLLQPSPHSISQSSIGSPLSFQSESFNNNQQQNSIKPDFTSMMTPPEEYEIPLFFDTNQLESVNEELGCQKSHLHRTTNNQPPSQSVVDVSDLSDQSSKKGQHVTSNKKKEKKVTTCVSSPSPPSSKGSSSSVGSFQCDFPNCTKTFTRTYNLKSHYRTHTDERPFKCTECPKSFARQHDRNRHEKLHAGSKPYLCEYCEKGFARQDALNRHLKRDKKNRESRKTNTPSSDQMIPPCVLMKIQRHSVTNESSD